MINEEMQPFLKWAGGKRQLLPKIRRYVPKQYNTYYEPFVGAGAVLFYLQPQKAVINDINAELINVYTVVRDNFDQLLPDLKTHKNEREYFYAIRALDREPEYRDLSATKKASRLIYLNKTCFNGLYRVNGKGNFNVPFGRNKNTKIVNEPVLRAVHTYLVSNDVTILNVDFAAAVSGAGEGDFVYFDPPYDPLSDTSSFTSYSKGGFDREEQLRLRDLCVELDRRGCKFLLSNSATDFIISSYAERGFTVEKVSAVRNINSVAAKRGKISEVLVRNYDP
jgi:DNA adenine methylase